MINYATIGPYKLTFGTFAAKRFCNQMQCGPTVLDILGAFNGSTFYDALVAVVLAGSEHTARAEKKPFTMDEFEACELIDANDAPEVGEYLMYSFVGSIANKTPEEVKAWLASFDQPEATTHIPEDNVMQKKTMAIAGE